MSQNLKRPTSLHCTRHSRGAAEQVRLSLEAHDPTASHQHLQANRGCKVRRLRGRRAACMVACLSRSHIESHDGASHVTFNSQALQAKRLQLTSNRADGRDGYSFERFSLIVEFTR